MPLPLIPIILEEAAGELIGAGLEEATGSSDIPQGQKLLEDKDTRDLFLLSATGGPGVVKALEQIIKAAREGRADEGTIARIAKNFGVEDKLDKLMDASKRVGSIKKAEEVLKATKANVIPEGFGKTRTTKKTAGNEILRKEAEKELNRARGSKKRAVGRFQEIASELGREADEVIPKPVGLLPSPEKSSKPKASGDLPSIGSKADLSETIPMSELKEVDADLAKSIDDLAEKLPKGARSELDKVASKGGSVAKHIGRNFGKYGALGAVLGLGAFYGTRGKKKEEDKPLVDTKAEEEKKKRDEEEAMGFMNAVLNKKVTPARSKKKETAISGIEKLKQEMRENLDRFQAPMEE